MAHEKYKVKLHAHHSLLSVIVWTFLQDNETTFTQKLFKEKKVDVFKYHGTVIVSI